LCKAFINIPKLKYTIWQPCIPGGIRSNDP
jgi:hypothetical protein